MPVGNWLILLVALVIVGVDISVTAPWTGLPVLVVMVIVVLAVVERMRQLYGERRSPTPAGQPANWLGGVLLFEGVLLAALFGFMVARGLVVWHMFTPEGADSLARAAAAQTYDLVFTVLAGFAGGMVIAPDRTGRVLLGMAQRPAVLLAGSFAAMIAVGSL
ncbi:MAG TPA: hypothetical protein VGB85_26830, partial [Nannocystis sp.]